MQKIKTKDRRPKTKDQNILKVCSLWSVVCGLLFLWGCAKTVTPIVTYGSQITVEINLAGNADITNNRYFLILSGNPALNAPLLPPDSMDEFLSVEDLPRQGSLESYYSNYYSTWSGYLELNRYGYYLTKGPFTFGSTATSELLSDFQASSQLRFNFRLDQIFTMPAGGQGSNIPSTIYFDIISVEYPLDSVKQPKDRIYPPIHYVQSVSGAETSGKDEQNPNINPSLDILSWKVIIQ